ncbi:hypothetical protein O0550_13070 [Brevibacillus halotolerans]|uniref:hypothetical protein n=1 Tax=Brevibacillus TaxID=55080 RepID=UPI00215BEB96|nr:MULTISPECIES: hypothetical protein [Brevibacillus]MCR8964126.1 hypothetical protein [Brevibacillus laterosporus]MCZ0836281.1 hypothetical protein [Brevibacillus halotolerans]
MEDSCYWWIYLNIAESLAFTSLGENGIEILGAELVANPKPLLPGGFEAKVVTFAFGAQSIDRFGVYALPVNRKAVIIEDGNIFGAAAIIPAIVSAWMITGEEVVWIV